MLSLIKKRELGINFSYSEKNLLNYIEKEKSKRICKEDHFLGYTPHVKNGMCRYCSGYQEKELNQIINNFNKL